ncbi:MAG: hypothetical protein GY851_33175, partial [bacterium]|nr:hypothetical protein [bacterium]
PFNAADVASGADQNASAAAHPVGTKWTGFQKGSTGVPRGNYTLIYLLVGTQNPDISLSCAAGTNKCVCCPEDASENGTATQMYTVTNDAATTTSEPSGLCAIAMSAVTNAYYGWFWCGGVAPISICAGLAGDIPTADSFQIGDNIMAATDLGNTPIGLTVASAGNVSCAIGLLAD